MTPLLTDTLDDARDESISRFTSNGKIGKSEEVAELALWLNSEKRLETKQL